MKLFINLKLKLCFILVLLIFLNKSSLADLIKKHDIVISYVPPIFHLNVAKICVAEKKNLVTSSYIKNEYYEFKDEIMKNNLIFLNEVGVDPGIDHLMTMKLINEIKNEGGKLSNFATFIIKIKIIFYYF